MSIFINEEDAKLFQQNGFSYDDVNNTVEHYRQNGLKDEEIQTKINTRLAEFKNPVQQTPETQKYSGPVMYATPKSNPINDFVNCLKWVNNTTRSAFQEGKNQTEIADLETKDMFHKIKPEEKARLEELSNSPAKTNEDYGVLKKNFLIDDAHTKIANIPYYTKKSYIEAIKMLPYMWETLKAGGVGGTVAGTVAGVGTGAITLLAGEPELALPLAKQSAQSAFVWGSRLTGATKIAELEGGLARNELKQINKEIIEQGGEPLNEAMIDALAIGVGGVNAGLETVGLKQMLKTVPNGDKILEYFEKKQLRELATNKTVREQLNGVLGQYAKAIATEVSTEMAQEVTNIVADETAKKFGGVENTPLEQNVARVISTGKATFGATAFLGGVGSTAKTVAILREQGVAKKQAEEIANNMTLEEKQDFVQDNYEILLNKVKQQNKNEEEKQAVEEDFYNKAVLTGRISNDEAFELSKLMGVFKEQYGSGENAEAFNNWYNKLELVNGEENTKNIEQPLFQSVENAGAESSAQFSNAQKEWEEKGTDSQYFKNWFGDSKVVDNNNKPLVVYHGSVQTFEEFDSDKASAEGDMGAGFYFTDNESDVNDNYYDGGPDFDNKVSRLAEQIQQDKEDEGEDIDYDEAKEIAEKQLKGESKKYEVYLDIKNPCYVGENETLLLSDVFDDIEVNEEDYEDYEDYEVARQEAEEEKLQTISYDLDDALGGLLQYEDIEKARGILFEYLYDGGVSLQQLKDRLNEEYFEDYDGNLVANEVARRIVEALGYDGIIDNSVADKFSNMGMESGTTHYIVFKPEQVKSIENQGTFDSSNANIYFQNPVTKTIKNLVDLFRQQKNESFTIGDVLKYMPQFKPVQNFFEGIKDVKVVMLSGKISNNEKLNGFYRRTNDTIYINPNAFAIKNIPTQRLITFFHELQHAHQKRTADKIYAEFKQGGIIENKEAKEQFIAEYENTYVANADYQNYIKKHRSELNQIQKLKVQYNYDGLIKELEDRKLVDVYFTHKELYNQYYNSKGEVNARETALKLIYELGLGEQYEREQENSRRYDETHSTTRKGMWGLFTRGFNLSNLFRGRNDRRTSTARNNADATRGRTELSKRIKKYYQSAYHGTPHRFEEFSLDAIGTGEGAQAHGWGLYFAGDKEVSEEYRKGLSNINHDEILYNGNSIKALEANFKTGFVKKYLFKNYKLTNEQRIEFLEEQLADRKKWLEIYKSDKNTKKIREYTKDVKEYQHDLNLMKEIDDSKFVYPKVGQLFEVDIPEDDSFLEEEEPLSMQSDKVFNGAKKLVKDLFKLEDVSDKTLEKEIEKLENNSNRTYAENHKLKVLVSLRYDDLVAKDFYNNLANYLRYENSLERLESKKQASLLLNKYGIKGITYDGQQDGRCYVVFDDKAVKVLKKYYQEANEGVNGEENLIAGYTVNEVLEKLTAMYDEFSELDTEVEKEKSENLLAKMHILEDALDSTSANSELHNSDKLQDLYLNAYYIMNNQEIPQQILEEDKRSMRTYKDLKDQHDAKREKAEEEYYGYFAETEDKNIIAIMGNSNSSTLLHEMGHLFLNGLNELATTSDKAKKQLEAVNKWLGYNGEYTVEQHEKFARSFEAYLYNGKAPNNRLREVFENFKKWLKSVYEHISNIPKAEISDEVQELFDRMFNDDEYYEERKQSRELLEKLKKATRQHRVQNVVVRNDSDLNETEKRHKEVSYDILSVGTGKSKKYLKTIFETNSNKKGLGKKRENIQELIEHVDDKITTSGGMREEWKEFYADTGVSYENDEIDGDAILVQQAFDTIINKAYKDPNKLMEKYEDERAQFFEQAVDDADRQYKILISNFKNGNRNVALSSYYDWIDSLNPEIKQDYEDRFIYDSAYIERNEKLSKFEKAKRNILAKAMELETLSINKNEQYKQVVMEIMKNLNFLQPSDKARMTANILDVPSVSLLMGRIDNIMDIAQTMEEVAYRRNLEREIHKELQQTKNIKKGARTVGKYDYKSNKIFEQLRELDRLSPEKANELRLSEYNFAQAEDNGLEYDQKLFNKFLSYKSAGRTFADTDLMKDLYDEIQRIKLIGKSVKSEQELQEKLSSAKDVDQLIKIVESKKQGSFAIQKYISMFSNLESCLNAIFNKEIKDKYGAEILYAETQSQAWQHEQKQKFEQEVAKIYNLPQWCWDKKIIEYLSPKNTFTYTEYRRTYDSKGELQKTRNIDRTLTKMDIILAYMWSKNEVLEKRLINQFGDEQLYEMFDELSLEDVKFAELMMSTAQSFYPLVNKAFIKKFGLDLPRVSCYFPSTPERGSEVDLYNDYSAKSLNNGFTKSRANSELVPMDFHNPVAILYSHIDGVAKFSFMSEALDTANVRLRNADLKRVIINKYGEDAFKSLEQELMNVTYKAQAPVFNGYKKILDNLIGNWIQANVSVKPIVGLKQLLSANNYAVDMPYGEWQKGFLKALTNYKSTIDYMMKIPYIKARYEGSFSNEFLKQTIENSAFAMSKKLKDCCNLFIKIGDIGAIIFGGKPYIDYLISQGMSEEQAIKQFILSTNRSQQSSAISSLSNFQVDMTRNPVGKLFIAFKNSPQQYVRMCGDAIISYKNGDISKKQCAKLLFQFGYLQPFLYATATSGSALALMFSGDPDDFLKDLSVSMFNLGSDAMPILGDLYKYLLNRTMYKEKYLPQTTPLLGDVEAEINKISKKDVSLADYLEAVSYTVLHVGAGYNTKAIANIGSGVGDVATGNFAQGFMKILGYTDKKAKHITGNSDKW